MSNNYWLGKVEPAKSNKYAIKLVKSSFYNEAETKNALADFIMRTDRLSMGEQCLEFEDGFAKKQGRQFALFVSSGSMANLVLVQALLNTGRLKRGDRVGFSALTWPTNVMPLIQLGLNPVPIDCQLETLNISPENLEKEIDNLQGLFITNVLGFADKIDAVRDMCEKKGVILFEDNCESLGSQVKGIKLGNFGIASTFSFFVGHHMSTIEGGMICTDDPELHDAMTMARAHGWDRNPNPDKQNKWRTKYNIDEFYSRYTFYDLAYNARPSEINGFLGNLQLQYFDEIVTKREQNFRKFSAAVAKNPHFIDFKLEHMDIVSNFSMPIICKDEKDVKTYKKRFSDAGVEIRPVIAGSMINQPFYKKYISESRELPKSEFVHAQGFYFGNNAELTDDEVQQLCSMLTES